MSSLYRAIMDPSVNPLQNIPSPQRFQIMLYLSVMWTTIFCTAAGAWLWYGEIIIGHVLVAFGFLVTGLIFHAGRPAGTPFFSLKDGAAVMMTLRRSGRVARKA